MPPLLHRQAEAGRHRRPGRALRAPLRQARRQEVEVAIATADLKRVGYRAKLAALARSHFGVAGEVRAGTFPGGASLREGKRGWVLAEEQPGRALGPALAWARQHELSELHVLAGADAGVLARRALAFRNPLSVWAVADSELASADPDPVPVEPPLPPSAQSLVDVIRAAGADPVVEHGQLVGEVLGLEVVRVGVDDLGAFLEVGVGKYDRMAQKHLHGDRPPLEVLRAAVEAVRRVRRPGAPAHQVNQIATERWLRAVVMARPDLAAARHLEPRSAPVARTDLRQRAPAPAVGVDDEGRPLVVVCSTGIDVDLVPAAADARVMHAPGATLRLVVPEGDDHSLTRDLASGLRQPAEVLTVPGEWRAAVAVA